MMQFIPLHDNVLIEKDRPAVEEKVSPGGLVLPKSTQKAPNTAKVVAVGPRVEGVKADDVVVVGDFSGTNVVVGDDEFIVVSLKDVLGIYK